MNLTKHDKTRFLERGFTVVENTGRNLRLIKRDDAGQAISIKWEDLSALRELITLALNDGPMVIGVDTSGQAAQNAASSMRSACVEKVEAMRSQWHDQYVNASADTPTALVQKELLFAKCQAASDVVKELESVSIQQEAKQ